MAKTASTLWLVAVQALVLAAGAAEPDAILKEDKSFWMDQGRRDVQQAVQRVLNLRQARNIIFFLGDGMGPSTVTAARIHAGQKLGKLGEEHSLRFEQFANVGLVKTYNVDKQVPDSAGTATAYLTGVKGRYGTLGLDVSAPYNVCRPDLGRRPYADSILKWAQDAGKDTGLVTTTRVTHATPAGLYAHAANRDWECDSQVPLQQRADPLCKDIARQLIEDEPGRNIKIILGGGRRVFLADRDVNGTARWPCRRADNLDLIQAWKDDKKKRGKIGAYLADRKDLAQLAPDADYVLGLFADSHIPYETDASDRPDSAPNLVQMTETAVKFLSRSRNGFFLLVEGGRIDHAHHQNKALKALEEAVALDEAVGVARRLTNADETLTVVTADHSHTFNINGYPVRGNRITGLAGSAEPASNGYNYTTLTYSTGPGFWTNVDNSTLDPHRPWVDPTKLDIFSKEYQQLSHTPTDDASHGGEDVAVYAAGAMAHLFHGVHEQSYIAHAMAFAGCLGPYRNQCDVPGRPNASPPSAAVSCWLLAPILIRRFLA